MLTALTGLLFAAGLVGLAVVDGDGDGDRDDVGMTTSSTTTSVLDTTTSALDTTTSLPGTSTTGVTPGGVGGSGTATTATTGGGGTTSTTAVSGGGSGLGAGGSATHTGSQEMADTGAELLLLPGLAALGLALGARRLRG